MMMTKNQENKLNSVNGTEPEQGGSSLGRCPVVEQHRPGRQSATVQKQTSSKNKRTKWSIDDNKEIMFCYYKSEPKKFDYLKRLYKIWQKRNNKPEVTKDILSDRARWIIRTNYFTKIQLDEIQESTSILQRQTETILETNPNTVTENPEYEANTAKHSNENAHVTFGPSSQQTDPILDCDTEILDKLRCNFEFMKHNDMTIPNMKQITSRKWFKRTVNEVNKAIKNIPTNNISETMNLIKAAIKTTAELTGLELTTNKTRKLQNNIPPWKQRIENTITLKRRDLSQLTELDQKRLKNGKTIEFLTKRYQLHTTDIHETIEIIKQEITALKTKVERYSTRCKFYRHNKLFETNQKRFYDEISGKAQNQENEIPEKDKVMDFWSKIWQNQSKHNDKAEWIKDTIKEYQHVEKQEDLKIEHNMVKKSARKMKNWKAAGADGIQGFWIKNLTNLHKRMATQLQHVLDGNLPEWMCFGRTTLILKDVNQPLNVANYRPITCLPTIWKLLTSIISDKIYEHLESYNLIPWQQKGCKKKSYGTKDQLLIDKLIMKHAKNNKRKLRMVWIDYKKAYDSVPHSWIIKCLKMMGVADNIIIFLEMSMKFWKTVLTINSIGIGVVLIKCGIFQGDSLSPILFIICLIPLSAILGMNKMGYKLDLNTIVNHLLYMDDLKLYAKNDKEIDALTNTVRIFSADINMEFGFKKCAKVTINRGKLEKGKGIPILDKEIKNLDIEEDYKYLGLLETNQFCTKQIKTKAKETYKKRLRNILKSKLHGRNQITAINTFALPVLTYPAGIIKFTKEELKEMDTMTRKNLTMYGSLHPRSDVDRLYVAREKGGRGLLSIEDSIRKVENDIAEYLDKTEEPILKLTKEITINKEPIPKSINKKEVEKRRETNWKEKKLHGIWHKHINEYDPKTNCWLQKSNLKPATESLILAAQDQALRTNWYDSNILKTSDEQHCRRCKAYPETIAHIVSGCPELAQGVYLKRHNAVASYLHWMICGNERLERQAHWYDHEPKKVLENEKVKVLYDFTIRTDKKIEHRKPDIVVVNKEEQKTTIIDIACPMDHNAKKKELEKINNYNELAFELERLWKTKTKIIPIVIGALGTITDNLQKNLTVLNLKQIEIHQLQKAVLLQTGNILRKHLRI